MSVTSAKAALAGLVKNRDPADPAITKARAALAEANARARVREVVAAWPPLSPEARAELAILLLSAGGGDA